MSAPVISVRSLGKQYWISHGARADTLRDRLIGLARRAGAQLKGRDHGADEEFWALRDVSFDIAQGDVVGVIGRNGAGKSTLLKLISRITEPTTGEIRLRGRVASLLEVGTGFHPELTGRENIFLNGAILGMSRAEIRLRFDAIVAFAEVERFLDMQVKHYSSGMYVRLAFAVAAHLEPEILIVDEVLAVGDAAFQKKCLGKMNAVARDSGRTVLFVSHSLPSVRQLCRSCILLQAGRVEALGPCGKVLEIYQHGLVGPADTAVPRPSPDQADRAYTTRVAVETLDGKPVSLLPVGQPWRVRIGLELRRAQKGFVVAIGLKSADGAPVQTSWSSPNDLSPGRYEAVFTQKDVILEAGTYSILVGLEEGGRSIQQFEAARLDFTGEGAIGYYSGTSGVGYVLNSMKVEINRT